MEIKPIYTQRVLSLTQINLAERVINPYRGCEFDCLYCYSRKNKNVQSSEFNKEIGVKINAPKVLEKELKYISPQRVLLGSTTECFQYAELKYGITEKIIRILNKHNTPYTILTKSHLIKNYLHLISKNKANKIFFTLNCTDDKIIKLLEAKAPSVDERLATIKAIINQGINLRLHIGPFIPYISNLSEILDNIPSLVKEIDIELYHSKMGDFEKILSKLPEKTRNKLSEVYNEKDCYLKFVKTLKTQILEISKQRKIKVFYIIPDFDKFYNAEVNYDTPLL
jgi:DNA repair photolyase